MSSINPKINILICRPDRLGDAVLALPLVSAIKQYLPEAKVSILARKYTEPIFRHNPLISNIYLLDGAQSFFELAGKLRKEAFDFAFSLLPNKRVNHLLFFAGIPNRYGVGHKFYQFLYNVKNVYRNNYIPLRHEADYCLDFLRKMISAPDITLPQAKIFLTEGEREQVNSFKKQMGGKKCIGIQVSSGGSAPNLPSREYYTVYQKLNNNPEYKVFILDHILPFDSISAFDTNLLLNKDKDLRTSFVSYASMDLVIGASTGPLHFSSALGVKTLGIYCPLPACSPTLWGPAGAEAHYLLPQSDYCSRVCPGDPKKCSFEGEGGLGASSVFDRIKELLKD